MNHKYVQGPSRQGLVLYQSFKSSVKFHGVVPGVVSDVVSGVVKQILNLTLTSVISTNRSTSLDPKGDLHLI